MLFTKAREAFLNSNENSIIPILLLNNKSVILVNYASPILLPNFMFYLLWKEGLKYRLQPYVQTTEV